MGHDTYNRIWESDRKHPRKLLLLALARYADARGVAWPKVETLARMMSIEEPNYARRLIAEAIADGDVISKPGGGRGVPSVYGVAADLAPGERRDLGRIVAATEVRKGVRYLWIGGEREAWSEEAEARLLAMPEQPQGEAPKPSTTGEGFGEERGAAVEKPPKARRGSGPPAHVAYLAKQGMGAAHLTADWHPEATLADYKARVADGWTNGAIWNAWKLQPPTPENIYGQAQKDQPERLQPKQGGGTGKPKPGDRGYYRR